MTTRLAWLAQAYRQRVAQLLRELEDENKCACEKEMKVTQNEKDEKRLAPGPNHRVLLMGDPSPITRPSAIARPTPAGDSGGQQLRLCIARTLLAELEMRAWTLPSPRTTTRRCLCLAATYAPVSDC
ncbi:hypothetical protein MSAN_00591300 [Mycena sanguinolenta]|uniref:Uncharacterized protein n=1 Tax=Mycena sanguinolenta TaxID=230812 RepID=A0A8H7DJQ3_9AGAR|nr:hypothetical protein MSAN_00591300 [Mycena sanguinolenta]